MVDILIEKLEEATLSLEEAIESLMHVIHSFLDDLDMYF